jgi:polar amino acid transport system substrate-binding protein
VSCGCDGCHALVFRASAVNPHGCVSLRLQQEAHLTIFNYGAPTRRKFLCAAASVAALGLPGRARAASFAEIKQRGTLVVAFEDDFQPFEFFQNDALVGYDVDLLNLIAQKFPFKVTQDVVPWTGILPGVMTGKYDVAVTAVFVTPQRLAALDMTTPVAQSVNYYLKRTRDTHIQGVKDLSGLTLGVEAGSSMLAQLPQLAAMLAKTGGKLGSVQQYQDYPSAYQDLANGRLDYVVNTQLNLTSVAKARPEVFTLGQPVSSPSYISWAMQKGNSELLELFNTALLAARKDGSMYQLQQKWFGATFEAMPEQPLAL